MGTPLPYPEYKKDIGDPYNSGAEWEFENAMRGHRLHKRPEVMVYRRMEKVLLDDEATHYEQKLAQKRLVKKFFDQFVNPETRAILRGVNHNEKPEDFRGDLADHLRTLIVKLIARRAAATTLAFPELTAPALLQKLPRLARLALSRAARFHR